MPLPGDSEGKIQGTLNRLLANVPRELRRNAEATIDSVLQSVEIVGFRLEGERIVPFRPEIAAADCFPIASIVQSAELASLLIEHGVAYGAFVVPKGKLNLSKYNDFAQMK